MEFITSLFRFTITEPDATSPDMFEKGGTMKGKARSIERIVEEQIKNWIASLVHVRHLWPDQYLQHLMKVIGIIGKHGGAVVVGRGANYILPPENRFRVRVVAPLEVRIDHVARNFDASRDEARKRVIRTESDRRAFIRKYFNADISEPTQYDLVINTDNISIETAAKTVGSAIGL
jgi:hypothetical protein